jgi:pentatricopeptide repeat protein
MIVMRLFPKSLSPSSSLSSSPLLLELFRRRIGSLGNDFESGELELEPLQFEESIDEKIHPQLPSFHELSCGGYNGRLAVAYRSAHRMQNILSVMETMTSAGERPASTLSYNYILCALLESGRPKDALSLLREMETRGLQPDVFTFEILLLELSKDSVMAVTVDELFHLMRVRYQLVPTGLCWHARLRAWMSRRNEQRVLQLVASTLSLRIDPNLYCTLCRLALNRNLWEVVEYLFSLFENGGIRLTAQQYYRLWQTRHGRISPRMVPAARIIFDKLDRLLLDEGTYVRLLYFCSRIGNSVSDLAFVAFRKLTMICREMGETALPKMYLEAYVACLEKETDKTYQRPPYRIVSRLDPRHVELARKINILLNKQ